MDPGNLGTNLKDSLAWFWQFPGFIALSPQIVVDPFNPKSVRASNGANFS